jgi:large subunit ribosomal protein L22
MIPASPRKVNLVAKLIRGMSAQQAVNVLGFCKKAVAREIQTTLRSAIANADMNYALNKDLLVVREAYVGKSVTLRRLMARAKGSGGRILKKFSRLTIVLCEGEG